MTIQGEQTVPVGPEHLWNLLMDPDILAAVVPGCTELEQTDSHKYNGIVSAKVGPIESRFDTEFSITDTEYPNRFRIRVTGQGAGGFVTSDVQIELVDQEDDATLLRYYGDTAVGGRLAAVGQRLLKAAAGTMIEKGFDDLCSRVEEELRAEDGARSSTSNDHTN